MDFEIVHRCELHTNWYCDCDSQEQPVEVQIQPDPPRQSSPFLAGWVLMLCGVGFVLFESMPSFQRTRIQQAEIDLQWVNNEIKQLSIENDIRRKEIEKELNKLRRK